VDIIIIINIIKKQRLVTFTGIKQNMVNAARQLITPYGIVLCIIAELS